MILGTGAPRGNEANAALIRSVDTVVDRRLLLANARDLAARLPRPNGSKLSCVLLASGRGAFMTGLYAAMLAGIDVLLPNDSRPRTLATLTERHPGLFLLTDHTPDAEIAGTAPVVRMPPMRADLPLDSAGPPEPADLITAAEIKVFTSGSTGEPVGHAKTWASMVAGAEAWARRLSLGGTSASVVATVPPQHMYGLESSILLPLINDGLSVADGRPFFAADIVQALSDTSHPRVLVTTPVHLKALLEADLDIPPLHMIVSATMPLSQHLAWQAEARLSAPVFEVFGSSETGMLATRLAAREEGFTLRDDRHLHQENGETIVSGPHVRDRTVIPDRLALTDTGFVFRSRGDDIVNIAGNRASLSGLNAALAELPQVRDGAFYLPEDTSGGRIEAERLMVFVVPRDPSVNAATIRTALRGKMADVFLPRSVVFVEALPRNENGKLPRSALDALYAERIDAPNVALAPQPVATPQRAAL